MPTKTKMKNGHEKSMKNLIYFRSTLSRANQSGDFPGCLEKTAQKAREKMRTPRVEKKNNEESPEMGEKNKK